MKQALHLCSTPVELHQANDEMMTRWLGYVTNDPEPESHTGDSWKQSPPFLLSDGSSILLHTTLQIIVRVQKDPNNIIALNSMGECNIKMPLLQI